MNLALIPGWLLSGAFFPAAGGPAWLAVVMHLNPLTYGVAALRWLLYRDPAAVGEGLPGLPLALAVTALFTLAAFAADLVVTRRGRVA